MSFEPAQFPGCAGADLYRNRDLTDRDFLPLLNDMFSTFAAPWTPTPTLSPTITRTPSITATGTPIPTPTATPRASLTPTKTRTPSVTVSPSHTPTQTATDTPTFVPTRTPTRTATATQTATQPPTATRTPTGVAYQLSGQWFVDWANLVTAICFDPGGQPFYFLPDGVYTVTAFNGQLDFAAPDGTPLARGVPISSDGKASFEYTTNSGPVCFGVVPQFVFDFSFTFNLNGTGSASAHWTYGFNTNCFVCDKSDTAVMVRRSGPGS
ncbi:MAG TPA: hypothetical protein VMT89_11935 [Candidatus Acidoferrales bacterium]|nr:hypothetical protein [Candidatus Acidoferrales bacterium]